MMTTPFFHEIWPRRGAKGVQKSTNKSPKMVVLDGLPNLISEICWFKIMLQINENRQGNAETHFQDNDPNEKLDTSKTL